MELEHSQERKEGDKSMHTKNNASVQLCVEVELN